MQESIHIFPFFLLMPTQWC